MEATEVRKLTELEERHWWYRERRHLLAKAVADLTPGRALDVGAAGGGNTRVLQSLGWQASALEYGPTGAEVCAARGIPVLRGDATALPLAPGSLDLVVAFDVLEHLDDDKAAAGGVFDALKPGGSFLVAVPCDPKLWSAHDDAVGHVRRYTRPTLTDLLQGAGFQLEPMTSWNVLMRPLVSLRRRSSTGSDLDDPSALLNNALRAVITLERYLPVKQLPGVTLLVRAKRPR
ncbi:class I SAM-dependent methyltransferase [Kineosporia sp. NBRC 101731]|uniref:class I SAM-dependent methyltransferase n=1 Tax=Kineosporia sp. NBRC 101731 TaxID=3032199 RepID=UPI0024A3530C|nr:class I SAM-dependent methyltransferase [Kineosporia sp. NBRC 101731]GLY31482.1 methyltransferase [Kineosporia sp. NBRC 101731]